MKSLQKAAALLLLSAMALAAGSCGETTAAPAEGNKDTPNPQNTATEAVTEETEPVVNWESANLPVKDFGGEEILMMNITVADPAYAWFVNTPESLTGEVLNDALYNRNQKIAEIYNVKFASLYSDSPQTEINKAVTAGDNAYDLGFTSLSQIYSIAQNGVLANWYDLPHVDLGRDWWDQTVISQLSYHEKLYACTGDISPAANTRTFVFVFNKDLCRELDLEMPYQTVLDGKWTLDKLREYVTNVNMDLNGDGVMDYSDRWGFFSEDGNSYMTFAAGGGTVVELDNAGNYKLTFNTERNIQLATKALELMTDSSLTLKANKLVNDNGGNWTAASQWFAQGNALMRSTSFEPIPRDYRSMNADFGVLPYPKFDESQKEYSAMADNVSARMYCVPATSDKEMIGLILESLAAESVSTVTPAYYDVCLTGKTVRDTESAAMLDIIFASKHFDIGMVLDFGGFRTSMTSQESKASSDVASTFAKIESKAQKALDKYAGVIDALD